MPPRRELRNQFKQDIHQENDNTKRVELIANFILGDKGIFSSEKAISGTQILNDYRGRPNSWNLPDINENTFTAYLSNLAKSTDSQINCPGARQGYYIDELKHEIEETTKSKEEEIAKEEVQKTEEIQDEAIRTGSLLEKHLYPFLERWLMKIDGLRVQNISSLKSQGTWGNPDIVGIKINNDILGGENIEITTIEAKITPERWKQWIFESVAHTVFANRSYFAFIYSEEHYNTILNEDLKHYAEMFNIGILLLLVSPDNYIKIQKKKKFELSEDNHRIVEYYPAPYNSPHPEFSKKFLQAIKIPNRDALYSFGTMMKSHE